MSPVYSLESSSRLIFIWREPEHVFIHDTPVKKDAYGSSSVLCLWLVSLWVVQVFSLGNAIAHTCRDDILEAHVRTYAGTIGEAVQHDDNARTHRLASWKLILSRKQFSVCSCQLDHCTLNLSSIFEVPSNDVSPPRTLASLSTNL
ncbi:hypothetical protein TNCV_4502811 [Trichonephila clavipes]|nr:hypothetical protein TNCV_4502811 [Trichonephila clavipes]